MFVHGMPFHYVPVHFPVLSPACLSTNRSREQIADALHLIELFGFEPVHFLRTSDHYPLYICMKECLRFGDTLLIFNTLPYPRLQLSAHEWGVREVDMRHASFVMSCHPRAKAWFQHHMPEKPFTTLPQSEQCSFKEMWTESVASGNMGVADVLSKVQFHSARTGLNIVHPAPWSARSHTIS